MAVRPGHTAFIVALLPALAVALVARSQSAQQSAQQDPQQPIFRAGVNLVRVDAVVSEHSGRSITDLTQDDFEIVEKGKRQTITNFKLIMLDGGLMADPGDSPTISSDAVEAQEAARDDVRLFTIFLDDYHVSKDQGRIVRQQLSRFVETQLGPTDMVGVMFPLTPLSAVRMTRNHQKVIDILQTFEGRRGDYTAKNAIEDAYINRIGPPLPLEQIRNEVVLSALHGLVMHMGGMKQGRNHLILVSEGFGMETSLARDGSRRMGGISTQMLLDLQDLASMANRNNTAIYSIDPQILEPDLQWLPKALMETLSVLAVNTGGRAIFDQTRTGAEFRDRHQTFGLPSSQLALNMKQMMVDASVYYLLGYNSSIEPDDKFHEISVTVKRRGVEVRHRQGYWARKPEAVGLKP